VADDGPEPGEERFVPRAVVAAVMQQSAEVGVPGCVCGITAVAMAEIIDAGKEIADEGRDLEPGISKRRVVVVAVVGAETIQKIDSVIIGTFRQAGMCVAVSGCQCKYGLGDNSIVDFRLPQAKILMKVLVTVDLVVLVQQVVHVYIDCGTVCLGRALELCDFRPVDSKQDGVDPWFCRSKSTRADEVFVRGGRADASFIDTFETIDAYLCRVHMLRWRVSIGTGVRAVIDGRRGRLVLICCVRGPLCRLGVCVTSLFG